MHHKLPGIPRRLAALLVLMVLAGCSVGGGGNAAQDADYVTANRTPTGTPVKMALVDSGTPALPALAGDTCVVYMTRPSADQVWTYLVAPVPDIFAWLGGSIRYCMAGQVQAALGDVPASFYSATLYIDTDGHCPAGDGACYYPNNPTVDQTQTPLSSDPDTAQWQLNNAVGHEVWHAVAGNFHP